MPRIDVTLPSGSIRGKRGSTVRPVPQWPTRTPDYLLKYYPRMTLPEALFGLAAQKLGYEWNYKTNSGDIFYQSPLLQGTYSREPGSTVADWLTNPDGKCGPIQIAIYIEGIFYHYEGPWADVRGDIENAQRVQAYYGFDVIFCDEDDILLNPLYIAKETLEFRRDHSRKAGKV